jgi:oxygen-independent coproporphyrinogen-3 oxidase
MNITNYPGIYIHIPFCQTKCGYCDFYSETTLDLKQQFLQSLSTEIQYYRKMISGEYSFDSLYIGGGTPSVLEAEELEKILYNITDAFAFEPDSEITLEINPGTFDYAKLHKLYRSGFTRMSIGVQSFTDHELQILDRIHTSEQAKSSILDAREAGFDSINIDLIYAMPNQTISQWLFSLETILPFSPEHISVYNLVYEKNTPFYQKLTCGDFAKHDNELEALFFTKTSAFLTQAGYKHYEISNYAKSDMNVSRHNYKYWNHTPYLSFGPSAHSFWNNRRRGNVRSIKKYIAMIEDGQMPVDFEEQINGDKLSDEFILLRLRTLNGINLKDYSKTFNKNFKHTYASIVENLIKENFAVIENDHFKLTLKGLLVCDEISPIFSV